MAKLLIILGLGIFILGLILHYAPYLLNWFGKLPGDINVSSAKSRLFIPITSMLLISIILSILINLFFRK